MINSPVVLSITQLNTYIKSKFDGDEWLTNVFVSGEISNFTNHYKSGHLYFSLKDDKCLVKAVMFSRNAKRLRFVPQNGMKVLIRGRVSIYEVSGQYQLYVNDMQPDGLGALNLAFEQLKTKLQKEGLFSDERKKSIPKFPKCIGVITSPTGAAVHDIITILSRRYPLAEVVFCPVLVQGEGSAPQIVNAIERFNKLKCVDIIILGRGGGSLEDLWPFNEEIVARAVSDSEIPIISAVGHETDFTICDFTADLRAPTPSAAAELAVPDIEELKFSINYSNSLLKKNIAEKILACKKTLNELTKSYSFKNPLNLIEIERIRTDRITEKLSLCIQNKNADAKAKLMSLSGRLNALSPLSTLSRGYGIVYDNNNNIVSKVSKLKKDDKVSVFLSDGKINCIIESLEDKNE